MRNAVFTSSPSRRQKHASALATARCTAAHPPCPPAPPAGRRRQSAPAPPAAPRTCAAPAGHQAGTTHACLRPARGPGREEAHAKVPQGACEGSLCTLHAAGRRHHQGAPGQVRTLSRQVQQLRAAAVKRRGQKKNITRTACAAGAACAHVDVRLDQVLGAPVRAVNNVLHSGAAGTAHASGTARALRRRTSGSPVFGIAAGLVANNGCAAGPLQLSQGCRMRA